jgi:hypothetical protein
MLGQPEQLDQPSAAHLLNHRGRGGGRVQPGVLVPSRGEPVCGKGSRQATPYDEAEEPTARRGHYPGISRPRELRDDHLRMMRAFGQRSA